MKSKESFIFHKVWWENTRHLPTEARCEIYDTLFRYVFEGVEPTFDPLSAVSMACSFIIKHINDDKAKYAATCEKRAAAGRRGNEKRWGKKENESQSIANIANAITESQSIANIANAITESQSIANIADNDNEYEYDNDTEKINTDFLFLEAEKKEKIIFDFALILLSEGRPNAYKEAKEAYNYNDATGWETEKTDKNGNVTKKRIRNQLAWMQAGWQRHNEQLFAPAQGMIMQSILQEYPAPMYADYINDFRGIRDEGENIAFLFSRKFTAESFINTFKNTHDYPQFRQAVIKHIKQNYPNANSLFSRVF